MGRAAGAFAPAGRRGPWGRASLLNSGGGRALSTPTGGRRAAAHGGGAQILLPSFFFYARIVTMILKPMIRNNICLNAHPQGARLLVEKQIEYVRAHKEKFTAGPKRVLVIGSSTGYGLAARIVAAFGYGAQTIGVAFEKPATEKRPATPGWYSSEEFDRLSNEAGMTAQTLIGDAFSDEHREAVLDAVAKLGPVDAVIYSLASGLRTDPRSGEAYRSVLKPIGETYSAQSLDPFSEELKSVTIEPATDEEAAATVKVMGGEDWQLWTEALIERKLLGAGAVNVAFSYIGPKLTQPIYRDGTIGRAKEHLEKTAASLTEKMSAIGGQAYVSVNKAVVTRASAVIPVVPLYMAILFKIMKQKGLHEDVIEQMTRLFGERLYSGDGKVAVDSDGRIRIDDWEMRDDVQQEIAEQWEKVSDSTLGAVADIQEYRDSFLRIHGFGFDEIDYQADVAL